MGILVLFKDNIYDIVANEHLDELIAEHKIIGFHRSMEWVQIGRDPLRSGTREYKARERRNRLQSGETTSR
ncbi:GSU3473 family protein [Geotalea sp. SG265]|uniref:GSU3473 family protein n=1 Tax=Geotalea sp. SG265 TaxID=2922867 RepID=UPI001FAF40C9|nr:hypothetical protein [Geotalea sp. SG265]